MTPRLVVIGAGPAGMAAAIAARTAGIETVVMAPESGRSYPSPHIETIPGIPATTGEAYADALLAQLRGLGGLYLKQTVTDIWRTWLDDTQVRFLVESDHVPMRASAVILATGLQLEQPCCGDKTQPGKDGWFVISGGGDAAVQYALGCAETQRTVLAVRGSGLEKCSAYLRDRAVVHPNLTIRYETVAEDLGQGNIKLGPPDSPLGAVLRESVHHALVGAKPNIGWAGVAADDRGFALTTNYMTSREGVFAAGDIRSGTFKRIAVAAGDGFAAGLTAVQWLQQKDAR